MQILIVSHVAPIRRSLQSTLERAHYRTLIAESLDEATRILSVNLSIDVVITEWNLMTGTALELQTHCQQLDRLADTSLAVSLPHFVILATPSVDGAQSKGRNLVQEIQKFGFRDVFEKPIDHTRILQRMKSISQERSVKHQAAHSKPMSLEPSAATEVQSPVWSERLLQLEEQIANLSHTIRTHDELLQAVQLTLKKIA